MGAPSPLITCCIGTFGETKWQQLALDVAAPSARADGLDVVLRQGASLRSARNSAAHRALGKYLLFLDADDEVEPGYREAMEAAIRTDPRAGLYTPKVRYVHGDEPAEASFIPERNLDRGHNYLIIGTVISHALFDKCEGFKGWKAYEDFALFHRAIYGLGAKVVPVEGAVYRANVNPEGRNSTVQDPVKLVRDILNDNRRWIRSLPR